MEGIVGSEEYIVITGDNDEPIFPIKYYNYYIYCDECGSFEWEAEVFVDGAPPSVRLSSPKSLVAACKRIIPFPTIINNRFAHPF
jgi:hypothetical protein